MQPICQSFHTAAQTTEATAVSIAAASSSINASDSAPFTAATTEMQPICQSFCAAAQTAKALLWYVLYQFICTNLYLLCFCKNSYIRLHLCEFI
jgi:hypothetical protein